MLIMLVHNMNNQASQGFFEFEPHLLHTFAGLD